MLERLRSPSLVVPRKRGSRETGIDPDRKSTRLNSSHTEIYTLSLHDALPIYDGIADGGVLAHVGEASKPIACRPAKAGIQGDGHRSRSEEHTSELQSHRDLHSFPTRRSSDL